jgi:hypothetical protein
MQIFQPLEPEDFALIKGKEVAKDDIESFCNKFSGKKKAVCWTEGSAPFREEIVQSPQNLVKFCGKADEGTDRNRCYTGLVYVITARLNLDADKMIKYCSELPPERRGTCFANAAGRMIETDYRNIDRAIGVCVESEKYSKLHECFKELIKFSNYNFHPGSEEPRKLCSSLPLPWNEQCLKGLNLN